MNEEQKYIDFKSYERVAELHKRERISAWRSAIVLQDVNGLRVSKYLKVASISAIIPHWKPSDVEQAIIPKLPKSIQQTISAKIRICFSLKAESKRLLDETKIMVEREIEKGGES